MKLNDVQCPGLIPKFAKKATDLKHNYTKVQCASYEVTFGTPMYKDKEHEEVVIEGLCDSCGHEFQVHGHIVINSVE